ncbi:aldehyde dehydrogenase family protein [Paenibacillus cymbidii]|uniref:aldehyde dehydrogenase family protein n=1 Tax=Paenibacillus cymbidii TaxID=1639034 RepID=UPI001F2E1FB3|nr:aldehyde dehydrogenase family protein [Paenibacillus cymbidii]
MELGKVYRNYINGQWQPVIPDSEPMEAGGNQACSPVATSRAITAGLLQERRNPARTGEIVGYAPMSGPRDVEAAVQAAQAAFPAWRRLAGPQRARYLERAADEIAARRDEIAETMTREMGKTLAESLGETDRGIAILRYYAGEGWRKEGDVIPSTDADGLLYTVQAPLGVVALITPWNFPVAIPLWKLAPALVYGNTAVLKPAEEATITAAKLMACFAAAGLPPGVVNMTAGAGAAGASLVGHPGVAAVSFTGSERVGRCIAVAAAQRGAKCQLEMGGKNPLIVAADADLELAAEAAVNGAFRSTGQKCTATSRVIVESGVYDAFKLKLLAKTKAIVVGDGLEDGVWMGPCASAKQLDTVLGYIRLGQAEGAELLCGGGRPPDETHENGYFVEPTIFARVDGTMTIAREEIFGPVLALIRAESLEEAIAAAGDSEYGLSASIYTRDIGAALRFARELEAGMIRINAETSGVELQAPFGGMKRSSSFSREQGQAAAHFYTSTKTIFIKG